MKSKKYILLAILSIFLLSIGCLRSKDYPKMEGPFACIGTKEGRILVQFKYNQKDKVITLVSLGNKVVNKNFKVTSTGALVYWVVSFPNLPFKRAFYELDRKEMILKSSYRTSDGDYLMTKAYCKWLSANWRDSANHAYIS